MYDFKGFYTDVEFKISYYLPSEYEQAKIWVKNKDVEENTALVIQKPDDIASPDIYLKKYYDKYVEGKTFNATLTAIANERVKRDKDLHTKVTRTANIHQMGYDSAKGHIVFRLVPRKGLAGSKYPYTPLSDMALVYRVEIDGAFIWIDTALLSSYNIPVKTLYHEARENTLHKTPPIVMPLKTRAKLLLGILPSGNSEDNSWLFISNTSQHAGACMVLYKEVQDEIVKRLGTEDYYIIMPSQHYACAIAKKDISYENMKLIAEKTYAYATFPKEKLSENVYEINDGILVQSGA